MATIINATTTNGASISADNSGSLQLATNNIGAININLTQDVGIGTINPAVNTLRYLDIQNVDTGTNAGIDLRFITQNSTNTGLAIIDIIKYRTSGFFINNNDTSSSNYTSFGIGGVETLRITNTQQVLVVAPSGLGYGAGAGAFVTQITSRTTGVTINKPTGYINIFSAAGSTTATTFTVTNSLIGTTDVILYSVRSATNKYVISTTNIANGSFDVTFYTTGGTATDAPVFNFTLIKGISA